MKRLAFVVLTASLLYIPAVAQQTAQATCGAWRWDVKTLSDPAKRDVNFHAKPARLKRFRLRKRPNITFGKDTPRTGQVEFQNWTIKGRPIQAKIEEDGDIHLVLGAPHAPAKTMIVEFPKKICVDDFYRRAKIAAARDKVLANCGKITDNSWTKLAGLVTVTGVGFWDYRHGQIGVARTRSSSTRR